MKTAADIARRDYESRHRKLIETEELLRQDKLELDRLRMNLDLETDEWRVRLQHLSGREAEVAAMKSVR